MLEASSSPETSLKRPAELIELERCTRVRPDRPNGPSSLPTPKPTGKTHPTGIKPWGNSFLDRVQVTPEGLTPEGQLYRSPTTVRQATLGSLAVLGDQLILDILGDHLTGPELARVQRVNRGLYAFARHEDLWRTRTIADFGGDFEFDRTWRQTYRRRTLRRSPIHPTAQSAPAGIVDTAFQLTGFYSDTLFHPWLYATSNLDRLRASQRGTPIPRRSGLSLAEFIREYEEPALPVIITDVARQWPAFKRWNREYLLDAFGHVAFRAEAIDITLHNYYRYADQQTLDESPIYLFDKQFGRTCPALLDDFEVPEYFGEDLFHVLGDVASATTSAGGIDATISPTPPSHRPDYRWIIIGPARSGSTFHKDPNATSAWNAVITGAKKWIMFPPDCLPPGVFTNADQSEVTSPVSLMEWFHNYYDAVKPYQPVTPSVLRSSGTAATDATLPRGAFEGTCHAGEIVFVPRGWWHCVLNLDDSVALTQNYVSRRNLPDVLDFLQCKRNQISGVPCNLAPHLYERFTEAFMRHYPNELEEVQADRERRRLARSTVIYHGREKTKTMDDESPTESDAVPANGRSAGNNLWQALKESGPSNFTFGFATLDESDEGDSAVESP
ncbi:hypothetical protein IWQ60_005820 [Tieghemiomyces parasiticus]|uniref:JmjC domain-containing protein n=1 Tax=Tieghemiomyces parasiticus TaxID=78921 RepID=A0A9W8A951_9FUNG|nr:hypothetical protein IWQ60_005820 [Tieghemiomyces parasiticus]